MNWDDAVEAIQRGEAARFRYRLLCPEERVEEIREAVAREPWADRVIEVAASRFCEPDQVFAVKELPVYFQEVLRRHREGNAT